MRPIVLLLFAWALHAQATPPHTELPSRAELDSISRRGTTLWRYDRAAWESTDELRKLHPNPEGGVYVVTHPDSTWIVHFGRLSAARDTFYTFYSASIGPEDSNFVVQRVAPEVADVGDVLHAARAVMTAMDTFGEQPRPYNHSMIPAGNGDWFVYLYPAQTSLASWPLGGDERFRISSDGTRILERHRMHKSIIDIPLQPHPDNPKLQQVAFTHTAIVDNRPEDTDVFAVISRDSPLPEYVVIQGYVYRIDKNGHITMPMKL